MRGRPHPHIGFGLGSGPFLTFPELRRAQGTTGCKTNATGNLTPHQIKSIGPGAALPDRQRLPTRTIPKLIYP
ncbi:hypothetical protein BH11ARM1_BH11ARM1_09640 [soil metagenome]